MNSLQGIIAVLHDKHGPEFIEAMRVYLARCEIDAQAKRKGN